MAMSLKTKMRRARARYVKKPTVRGRRYYLRLKAQMRIWDDRYLDDYGPGISSNVNWRTKKFIMRGYARNLIVSSTTGRAPRRASNSMHPRGRAADMVPRSYERGTYKGLQRMIDFQRAEYRNRYKFHHQELIGPDNRMNILGGYSSVLREGSGLEQNHDTHVHGGF